MPWIAAQSQRAGVPDEDSRPYTVESAPEALIWRIFLQQVFAHQERAADLERVPQNETAEQAKQRAQALKAVRERTQRISRLNPGDFAFLLSVANEYADRMERLRTRAAEIAGEAKGSVPRQEDRAEAATLWKARDEILARSLDQLRKYFGQTRFQELDRRIREHIVPRLGTSSASPAPSAAKGQEK